MALTLEALKGNDVLKELDENVLGIIVKLSKHDEDKVVGKKQGEAYGNIDNVFEELGFKKESGSTSNHARAILKDLKTKAEAIPKLNQSIETLRAEKKVLEEKASKGANSEILEGKIKDLEKQLETKVSDYESQIKQWKVKHTNDLAQKETEYQKALSDNQTLRLDFEFENALRDVKWNANIPEIARNATIEHAKKALLTEYKTDFITREGKQVLVFKDSQGEIQRNNKDVSPLTARDLLTGKLKDLIDTGKQQQGTGTGSSGGGSQQSSEGTLDLSGAKTKSEATKMINSHLMQNEGLRTGTDDFQDRFDTLYKENEVSKLSTY